MYAHPRTVKDVNECLFYHSLEIHGLGPINGLWNLIGRLDDYIGGVDVKGRRVLDVGCASGFLSFEMEKRGAEVVSFDAESATDMDRLPFAKSLYSTNRKRWEDEFNEIIDSVKRSYWFAYERIRSNAKVFYGDIYNLPEELGSFDVAVIGQILVHLSDPISAIGSVGRICSDTLVITERMLDTEQPIMKLCADPDKGPDWARWHLSVGLYRSVLKMMGFGIMKLSEATYESKHLGPNLILLLQNEIRN